MLGFSRYAVEPPAAPAAAHAIFAVSTIMRLMPPGCLTDQGTRSVTLNCPLNGYLACVGVRYAIQLPAVPAAAHAQRYLSSAALQRNCRADHVQIPCMDAGLASCGPSNASSLMAVRAPSLASRSARLARISCPSWFRGRSSASPCA